MSAVETKSLTLRGLTWDHPRAYAPLEAASQEYAALARVQLAWERRSLKDFGDQQLGSLARCYDLLVIDHPHVGMAAEQGFLAPLDEYLDSSELDELAEDSPGWSHQSYCYAGHQWALAIDAACQVAASRPDLLHSSPKQNVADGGAWPATWDDATRLSEQLRAQGRWMGMALCPTDCGCIFLTLLKQLTTSTHEEKVTFDPDSIIAALECLSRLKNCAHPESTAWDPIQLYEAMSNHDEVAYSPLAFGYINYAQRSFRHTQLAFGPIPGLVGALLGGAGIAVSRYSFDLTAATGFAAFVASGSCQAGVYVRSGGQPAHVLAWQGPNEDGSSRFFCDTHDTLRHAFTRPRYSWWPQLQSELGELIHEFLIRDTDVAITAREIHGRYERCREMK